MNDIPGTPFPESKPSVFQVWMKALTKPYEQTFVELASSPNVNATTAYLWVFVASIIQFFLTALVQSRLFGTYMNQLGFGNDFGGRSPVFMLVIAICGAPILAAISTLFFALSVFVVQWIAKMFGGRGTSDQLAYTMAAIVAPYSIIAGIITLFSAIPYVGLCFSAILSIAGIYVFVLQVMAVKGVNQFGWGAAIGSLLIPGLVIAFLCACLIGGSFAALYPMMRSTMPNIAP